MIAQALPSSVLIREVGPREGFQILPRIFETQQKLKLIQALVDAGLSEIEVTAFVRPDRVPAMADAEALVAGLPTDTQASFSALYLNVKGFQRAEATGVLRNKAWLYSSPSESFLRSNNNTTINEALASVPMWCDAFHGAGKRVHGLMVSTAFGCGFEGHVKPEAVLRLVERYRNALSSVGEDLAEICLADTIGVGHPNSVRACIQLLRPLGIPLSLHLHNTWGLGVTNVYAGLCEGVSIFETSIGGLGGCPFTPGASGNVATEDVVYLCHALGVSTTLNFEKLCCAAELAESVVGASLSSGVYKAWRLSEKKMS
jgi:hydroxymethylglutaryl-CoA lyase